MQAAIEKSQSMTIYCCTKEEGEGAGHTLTDICKIKSRTSGGIYYLMPNNNYDDINIKHELSIAKKHQSIIETASAPAAS
jgi:hypothetical protein